MKKYILWLVKISCIMHGMDNKQPLSKVERTMIKEASSQLSFTETHRILHIGSEGYDIVKKKTKGDMFVIEIDTLNNMQEGALTYDKIVSFTSWNILNKAPYLLEKSVRLLKHNGQFCIITPYHKSPYLEIYNQTITNDKWQKCFNAETIQNHSRKKIKELCEQAKIHKCCMKVIIEPFVFKCRKKFHAWVLVSIKELGNGWWWYHEDLAHDIVENYLKKYPRSTQDRSITLHFPYVIMRGSRSL